MLLCDSEQKTDYRSLAGTQKHFPDISKKQLYYSTVDLTLFSLRVHLFHIKYNSTKPTVTTIYNDF